MLPKGTLGPGILGEDLFEQEKVETTKGRSIFGPGIVDPPKEPEPAPLDEVEEERPVPAPVSVDIPNMSVEKLKDLVIGNPSFLDGAIEIEFKREPSPRRTALRFFTEIERENENRVEVLQRLEDAMG